MGTLAIRARGIGKQYRVGAAEPYRTFREALVLATRAPLRGLRRERVEPPKVWALRDVSFDVHPGEIVGIIGRNGAGKSTLLKLLSRITAPTTGEIELRGRVGALLEVGTGFHLELTGRENIYLNGAILGMKRAEIRRKFDAIVSFSEIEKFLDTPVKHYSSGMFMRLAFAVAAHLEPEILIVDEVLAVGDASFQKKCLNKMQDVSRNEGRTVLFVSHNMPAVARLCPRAVLLDGGRVLGDGLAPDVIRSYLDSGSGSSAKRTWTDADHAPGNHIARLRAVRCVGADGTVSEVIDIRREFAIEITFDVLQDGHVLVPNIHVFTEEGICAFIAHEIASPWHGRKRRRGKYTTRAWIPGNFLSEGTTYFGVAITTLDPVRVHLREMDVIVVQVVDSIDGGSARGQYAGPYPGAVRPMLRWECVPGPDCEVPDPPTWEHAPLKVAT
jgi:lipopolysaccharide transport system ATP-binding protein